MITNGLGEKCLGREECLFSDIEHNVLVLEFAQTKDTLREFEVRT